MPGTATAVFTESEVRRLRDEVRTLDEQAAEARASADEARNAAREEGVDLTEPEHFERIDGIYAEADGIAQRAAEARERYERALEVNARSGGPLPPRRSDRGDALDPDEAPTIADRFIRSGAYHDLLESGRLEERLNGSIRTDPVEVMQRAMLRGQLRTRATIDNTSTSAGGLVAEDLRLTPVESPVRQVRVLDLITIGDTDSDTVEWVEQTTRTSGASNVGFGTAASEATYEWQRQTETVRRMAHFVPATQGVLADAGQLRTLIESDLLSDLRLHAETQVLSGDGTGENFTGILNASGIGSLTRDTTNSEKRLDAIHRAITSIRVNAFDEPTAILMHPSDYEEVVTSKDDQNQYHVASPFVATPTTIWGVRAVVSTVITENTVLVGDFARGATMWLRSGASISISDSHSDFFTKGLLAILATMRAAFAVQRPERFTTVDSM